MSRMGVPSWLGVAALLLLGCGTMTSTPPDRSWTEIRSMHFLVQSDLKPAELESLALDFERSYEALHSYIFPGGGDLPGESRVIVVATENEYRLFYSDSPPAFFRSRSGLLGSSQDIIFSDQERRLAMEVFQHELSHRFVAHYFPGTPRWVNEGLAEFLSSATLEDDQIVVGTPASHYEFDGWQWKVFRTPFADVWPNLDELRVKTGRLEANEYAGSWALVHTLLLGDPRHRAAFGSYMTELHEGQLSEQAAFAKHIDARLLGEVQAAYQGFPRRGNLLTETVKLRRDATRQMSLRSMTRAEAYALWGEIRSDNPLQRALAFQDAEQAIKSDAQASAGYVLRGTLHFGDRAFSDAERDLRQAFRLEPERRETVHALAALLLELDGATKEIEDLMRRLRGLARRADDYELLARWELAALRPERAKQQALKAAATNPSCFMCYETAATAAARSLDFAEAARLERTAISVAAERSTPAMPTTLQIFEAAYAELAASGPASASKGLSNAAVRAVVRANFGLLRACYRRSMDRRPGLEHRIKLRFELDASGAVIRTEQLKNDFVDVQIAPCIVEKFSLVRFPPPAAGGATFVHTIGFRG
jgi:tetratricopeptide (TPR) repeat protein